MIINTTEQKLLASVYTYLLRHSDEVYATTAMSITESARGSPQIIYLDRHCQL